MKKLLFLFALLALFATACKKEKTAHGPAFMRLQNGTPYPLDGCVSNPGSGPEHLFGHLDTNAVSAYYPFDSVYTYGYTVAKMNGRLYFFLAIDYVGETPFTTGYFTYKIVYLRSQDRIVIHCIQDH